MKKYIVVLICLLLGGMFVAGYLYGSHRTSQSMMANYLIGDQYKVVRTPGGMLEVTSLKKPEAFAWKTTWTCPANLCSSLPAGNSTVSGVASYTYRVALADHWVLEKQSGSPLRYVLKVPRLEAKSPVAIDLQTIQFKSGGSIFAPSGPTQTAMLSIMQPLVNERASSPDYLKIQSEAATKTIVEFARKWMREGDVKLPEDARIEVVFGK